MNKDRVASTEAEMDAFLTKPLRLDTLRAVLMEVQNRVKRNGTM